MVAREAWRDGSLPFTPRRTWLVSAVPNTLRVGFVEGLLLPVTIGFVVALIATPAGVSGAFLLLPVQMSVLHFVAPAVSPTNLLFNVIATPAGIISYQRESRLDWDLTRVVIAGTTPGIVVGAFIRIRYLGDPQSFKIFVGIVLLALAIKLWLEVTGGVTGDETRAPEWMHKRGVVFSLAGCVGLIGGIYGIGGGAIIAPFFVAVVGLSIYSVAGAALASTLVTSLVGLATFRVLGVSPDWLLGSLFGIGGAAGSYVGARAQQKLAERGIKALLAVMVGSLGLSYVLSSFGHR